MITPRVSVVVPTYERSFRVRATLSALARMEPPSGGFETIVVDDGSSAEHAESLARSAAEVPAARVIRQENRGPAAARNAGVAVASGELIAFLDDDCVPSPDWLVRLTAPFDSADPWLAAVGGRVLPAPPTNWVARFLAATEYSSGVQAVFVNAATANACYRRSVLEELDGFDERFLHPGGDDPDLSERVRRAGYRLKFVSEAVVYHSELESYRDFLHHMYCRGLGEARLGTKYGRSTRVVLRGLLLPAFLIRAGAGTWKRTAGKAGFLVRLFWLVLEVVGQTAFVAGSLRGLVHVR